MQPKERCEEERSVRLCGPIRGSEWRATLNKAEYISIAPYSGPAEIDAAGELWLCIPHIHTNSAPGGPPGQR